MSGCAPAKDAIQRSISEGQDDHYTIALLRHNITTTEADIEWLDQLIAFARTEQTATVPKTLRGEAK